MGEFFMAAITDCESFCDRRCEVNLTEYPSTSCENTVLWRGHFVATGNEKSVNLSINGGEGGLDAYYCFVFNC